MWGIRGGSKAGKKRISRDVQQFRMGGKCNFSYKWPLMHLVAKLCLTETHVLSRTFCNLTTEQMRGETRLKEESTMLTNNIAHIKLCIFSESESGSHKNKTSPREENGFSNCHLNLKWPSFTAWSIHSSMELHFNFLKPQDVSLISNSVWTVIFNTDKIVWCSLESSKEGSSF